MDKLDKYWFSFMTIIVYIAFLMGLCLSISGCDGGVSTYAAGVGTGLTAQIIEANEKTKRLNEYIDKVNKESNKLEAVIKAAKDNPSILADYINPELKDLIANSKELKEKDVDWKFLLMSIGLGIFGGGTGVNLFKNRNLS